MGPNSFNKQMEEYLLEIIRTGENGNIYRCLVLKTDNQKLKVRDAWTWIHDTFNLRFGTQFNKEFLRKKYSYLFLVLLFIIPQLWKLKQLIETLRDVLRRLLYGPKNFYPDKRLWRRDEMFRDEMFRDEMFWDEFYEPASGHSNLFIFIHPRAPASLIQGPSKVGWDKKK